MDVNKASSYFCCSLFFWYTAHALSKLINDSKQQQQRHKGNFNIVFIVETEWYQKFTAEIPSKSEYSLSNQRQRQIKKHKIDVNWQLINDNYLI